MSKLYHGTSERFMPDIRANGLRPRGKRKGNWQHSVESCPDAVYLTNAYALHYAGAAAKGEERLVVLEIDTTLLAPWLLTPDEDWLEQTSRKQEGHAPLDKSIAYRTRWYRKRLRNYADFWQTSLERLGNCAYHGPIHFSAVTRVATVDHDTYVDLVMVAGMDPTIHLTNYLYCGPKYRNGMRQLFGDTADLEPDALHSALPAPPERAAYLKAVWGRVHVENALAGLPVAV